MLVRNANSINWKPLNLAYMHDPDLTFKGKYEYFDEGFNFVLNDALVKTQDVSVNKYMNFYLTNLHNIPDIMELSPKKLDFPKVFSTHLMFQKYSMGQPDTEWFLHTEDTHGIIGNTSVTKTNNSNGNYFEVHLIDNQFAKVRFHDGKIIKCLTYNPDIRTIFYFEPDYKNRNYTPDCDPQTFTYIYNKKNHTILLTKRINNTAYCIVPVFDNDSNQYRRLDLEPMSTAMANIEQKVWKLRPQVSVPKKLKLQTSWVSYTRDIEQNKLDVNKDKCHSNIDNNFLLMSYTDTLSASWPKYLPEVESCNPDDAVGKLNVDIVPLKNQLTLENKTSRGNIFDHENSVNHRLYHGLHTGTNQEHGFDSIYLSYATGTTELLLPSNKVTYFHFPVVSYPYEKLNVNHSKLVDEGAMPSNSPIKADKIFKKRSADNNIEEFVDEKNGTWLCTWLSGAEDPNVKPIWVDRYYNPNYFTKDEALGINTYKAEYDKFLDKLPSSDSYVTGPFVDEISKLTFEPGVLYAYHRIGCNDLNSIVKTFDDVLLIDKLETYKDLDHVACCETTVKYCDSNIISYELDSDRYGITKSPNKSGPFTLTFELDIDDWQKPFAHSIIGNYDNDGISVYNEENVTPFFVVPVGPTVMIYNSEFKEIKKFDIIDSKGNKRNIQFLVKKEGTNSFWVLDEDNIVHEYDMKGVERNRISEHGIVASKVSIADMDVDDDNNVYLLRTPGLSGDYIKLTATLSGHNMTCENVAIADSPAVDAASCNQYGYFKPVLEGTSQIPIRYEYTPTVTTINDATLKNITARVYHIKGQVYTLLHDTKLAQGTATDGNGNFYYVLDNKLYHTTDPRTIKGSAIAVPKPINNIPNSIEAINCDKHGDLWIVYTSGVDRKLTKLQFRTESNKAAKIIGTPITLDVPSNSLVGRIEFSYEFTKDGYKEFALYINKWFDGDQILKINTETNKLISKIQLPTQANPLLLEPAEAKLPIYGVNPETGTTTNTITGWRYLHTDTSLSAHDVWPVCHDKPVEETDSREFIFKFTVNNEDMYTIDFHGDNKVEGYLDSDLMGTFDTDKDHLGVSFVKTLTPGNHILRFIVSNTKGKSYKDNPLTLSFVLSDAVGDILLTSRTIPQSDILHQGFNPCTKSFAAHEGLRAWKDISGSTFYQNNIRLGTGRYIRAKLKSKNLYSGFLTKTQNTTFYLDWEIPSNLKSGSHYITIVYDSLKGYAKLYIDSILKDEKAIGLGRYAFSDMLSKPLLLGTTAFFGSEPLFRYLKQNGYFLTQKAKVTDLRLYNIPLSYYDIFAHMSRMLKIRDIKWDLPTGQRNFIDTIERMFKFKTRDRKSNAYNLRILNSFVEHTGMRDEIEKAVREYVKYITPLHTDIKNIQWRNDKLGTTETNPLTATTGDSNAY